jgi:hypothetical protein
MNTAEMEQWIATWTPSERAWVLGTILFLGVMGWVILIRGLKQK